ncbi:MAG: DUF523 domain-containing protein [Desulfosarcinaceae bacterium]|jgi:uncharacterized protein YbbK (DUF523 family)
MAAEAGQIQAAASSAKILISACLIGQRVRYDGGHQRRQHPLISAWQGCGRLVPCCPEVLGGLPIPRPPAEINGGDGGHVLRGEATVNTAAGADVTPAFLMGAEASLALARSHAIRVAILCQRSPSCGSRQIYNGRFEGVLIPGVGVTAALLRADGIAVFGPEEIDAAARRLDAAC